MGDGAARAASQKRQSWGVWWPAGAALGVLLGFGLVGALVVAAGLPERYALPGLGLLRVAAGLAVAGLSGTVRLEGGLGGTGWGLGVAEVGAAGPPLLLHGVIALIVLGAAVWRRRRDTPPANVADVYKIAWRAGVAFAVPVAVLAWFGGGRFTGPAGMILWETDPLGAAVSALLLGTVAAGGGAVLAQFRGAGGSAAFAGLSAVKRSWLRAVAGSGVAAAVALSLAAVVAVFLGVAGFPSVPEPLGRVADQGALAAFSLLLVLPVLVAHVLTLALGGSVVLDGPAVAGLGLLGADAPARFWLLPVIPLFAAGVGGLWTAWQEWRDPEPRLGVWLRYGLMSAAGVGLLVSLAPTQFGDAAAGVAEARASLPEFGPGTVSARPAIPVALAFLLAAAGGYLGELWAGRRHAGLSQLAALRGRAGLPFRRLRLPAGRRPRPAVTAAALVAVNSLLLAAVVIVGSRAQPVPPNSLPPVPPAELADLVTAAAGSTEAQPVVNGGSQAEYVAGNTVDADSTTAWRVYGDGVGQSLVLEFPRRAQLNEVGLLPGLVVEGDQDATAAFQQHRRIQKVEWSFEDDQTVEQSFEDTPELQHIPVDVLTGWAQVEILETRDPKGADPYDDTFIAEVSMHGVPLFAIPSIPGLAAPAYTVPINAPAPNEPEQLAFPDGTPVPSVNRPEGGAWIVGLATTPTLKEGVGQLSPAWGELSSLLVDYFSYYESVGFETGFAVLHTSDYRNWSTGHGFYMLHFGPFPTAEDAEFFANDIGDLVAGGAYVVQLPR